MHPRTSTSRCSHREQRRRHPCNRRNTPSISLRRVDSSRADAQGAPRLRRGGPPGSSPRAPARGRGWAHTRGPPRHRGGPPAPGAAGGLEAGCVRAPGPAGGTLTRGRASDRAARLRRTLGARCRGAKTRASPPGCDPRGSQPGVEGGGQGPHRGGNPRQVPPGAATDQRALSTGRGERRTRAARPRERGRDPGVWSWREVHTARIP